MPPAIRATPTSRLVDALIRDLSPVRPFSPRRVATPLWLVGTFVWTAAAIFATGGLRAEWLDAIRHAGLQVEFVAGGIAAGALLAVALERDVPGALRDRALAGFALVAGALWLGTTIGPIGFFDEIGLHLPEASMAGKRPHCFREGLVIAIPPTAISIWLIARRSIRPSALSCALAGFAAGLAPALAMQLACMHAPDHAARWHVPLALVAAAVATLGARLVPPRA